MKFCCCLTGLITELVNNGLPFPLLFTVTNTEQSLFLTSATDWRISFNVLPGDIYAANQYFNTFLYHDFGTLLGKTRSKVLRPRIAIALISPSLI
jgi:hypothetical protein